MPPTCKKFERLLLVGPMGVGKTTIGKLLAEETGRAFKDCDQEVERRTGADIAWIFDREGEAAFRDREAAMLKELACLPNLVLATGGGAVLREGNRRLIREAGLVIYLEASLELLLDRTAQDKKRPLLQTGDPKATLARLLEERAPLYRSVADLSIQLDAAASRWQTLADVTLALRSQGHLESA